MDIYQSEHLLGLGMLAFLILMVIVGWFLSRHGTDDEGDDSWWNAIR